ncbi:hypothetical protein UGC_01773 [Staphylococcus aureus M0200]|nr:hypothetical protein UEY_00008 [Staphylococcus aureus M0060]ENI97340.1 hypothetical protein B953_00015 [Staphylococcus aureus M0171]ENJ07531.1 hypothetical protein UGC_01773 [Staphylococcus aureus M0200]ENJ50917.1 hypothetical protein B960_01719 [Staphylococcus aureus M0288]ENJ58660.1 hypothetical protein SYE_02503 [Staphylococcus aureus M0326]ENJ78704.1 hypothetical protein UGS_00225 [Staphylococcus aureus M0334]ENJ92963.1 hypothetical protein UI5_02759 [Staphylococcus aureus M0375]ENM30
MPLFLQPILKTKLWGGQRLSEFGYQLDNDTTGECWCIVIPNFQLIKLYTRNLQ